MNKGTALLLACLSIASFGCGDRTKTETITRQPVDTVRKASPPPPSAPVQPGIGIPRDSLLAAFRRQPLGFVFEQQKRSDGQESWLGLSQTIPGGTIELVGPAASLTNANCLIIVGGSNKDDTRAAITLVELASLVDKSGTDWLNGQMQEVAKAPKMSRHEEKRIGDRIFRFNYIYLEKGGTMSLAIVPAIEATQATRRR
jgi:hypothetical protein